MLPSSSFWTIGDFTASGEPLLPGSVVTIGVFDGVHPGHRHVLTTAISSSRARSLPSVAMTFHPHPAALLRPEWAPRYLTSLDDKIDLILQAGIDHVVVMTFDEALAHVEPVAFLRDVLVGRLGLRQIVVGEDFRFGRGGEGDVSTLKAYEKAFGYETTALMSVQQEGHVLSSTEIRRALTIGDVTRAAALLGRPYSLAGTVVPGDARGRVIGFPTANVERVDGDVLVPGDGVYTSLVNGRCPAVTVIGTRPSFGGDKRVIETHLLDFQGDLYGKRIRLELLGTIRGVMKFDSVDALVAQITNDVAQAKAFFATSNVYTCRDM